MSCSGTVGLSIGQRRLRSHSDSTPPKDVAWAIIVDDSQTFWVCSAVPSTSKETMAPKPG